MALGSHARCSSLAVPSNWLHGFQYFFPLKASPTSVPMAWESHQSLYKPALSVLECSAQKHSEPREQYSLSHRPHTHPRDFLYPSLILYFTIKSVMPPCSALGSRRCVFLLLFRNTLSLSILPLHQLPTPTTPPPTKSLAGGSQADRPSDAPHAPVNPLPPGEPVWWNMHVIPAQGLLPESLAASQGQSLPP